MKLIPGRPPAEFRMSLAATYDAVALQREEMGEAGWRWPLAESFLELMRSEGKTRLLEIGAGVGFTSRWFADRGVEVTATDLSPEQVELCRAKGLAAEVRDLYELGFAPASFDAAWAMNCTHHVAAADLHDVLTGIAAVLVPGGLFYLGVWGGQDEEGMYEDDFYLPPRFFSLRSDAVLRRAVEAVFSVESFETFVPDDERDDERHLQSLVLRVPR